VKHATLYRKWRPRRFGGIVGQEPVVRTLRRAIETGRVSHAYLFSGPRGTGKTSTAKVLAMGLNCVHGPTPEPCGECESCRAIVGNSSLDVLEMDAASNRGIDEIRELRDKVNLAPAAGRMKVYIIDEVHMLTAEAFNALLKMLEEPPEHVVFVLATTEKHKVLPTIISRCQSFDFRRPSVETLAGKLAEISSSEGIEVEPEALTLIAREGRGSFRDAEGLLDQLSSFGGGEVTAAMVRELLGSVGSEVLVETTAALHERRAADALRIVDRLSNEGKDLGQFVGELLGHLRRLMLLPHAPEVALADVGADERGPLEEQAGNVPTAEVMRLAEALGDSLARAKRGGDPKLELELTFLKLARDYTEPSVDALLRRIEALETRVGEGVRVTASGDGGREEPAPREVAEAVPEPEEQSVPEGGEPEDEAGGAVDIAGRWRQVIQDLRERRQVPAAAVFEEARVEGFDGEVLELAFPGELAIYATLARDERHLKALYGVLEERFGVRPRLECRVSGGDGAPVREAPPAEAPVREAPHREREESRSAAPAPEGGGTDPEASGGNGAIEAEGDDDIIRDQREVFEMARERFGLFDENGGS
jgi:DNA polymerase-3 subunit gamma/tau